MRGERSGVNGVRCGSVAPIGSGDDFFSICCVCVCKSDVVESTDVGVVTSLRDEPDGVYRDEKWFRGGKRRKSVLALRVRRETGLAPVGEVSSRLCVWPSGRGHSSQSLCHRDIGVSCLLVPAVPAPKPGSAKDHPGALPRCLPAWGRVLAGTGH